MIFTELTTFFSRFVTSITLPSTAHIASDIRWYVLSLIALILAFGEMFYIVLSSPSSQCAALALGEGFCSASNQGAIYLRTYAFALGGIPDPDEVSEGSGVLGLSRLVYTSKIKDQRRLMEQDWNILQ
mmetsp:Transcript_20593/g.59781  ORF Transcript_20593/g.59781 Transcript_20593/m.59781 type:complete len:128 (-) Transcript_20593:879-1262(-)